MGGEIRIVCPRCGGVNRADAAKLRDGGRPDCGACGAALFVGPGRRATTPISSATSRAPPCPFSSISGGLVRSLQMMAPHFPAAARALETRVRFLKADAESLRETAARFGIKSIPTLILFRGGREFARQAGAMDAKSIQDGRAEHGAT